jgi:hypothetical protein
MTASPRRFTPDQERESARRYQAGETLQQLAAAHGAPAAEVRRALTATPTPPAAA